MEQVICPDIGDVEDAEVFEILVQVGDFVEIDDSLISLETDKASMELPSPIKGIVKRIYVKHGDHISQGDLIAEITTVSIDNHEAQNGSSVDKKISQQSEMDDEYGIEEIPLLNRMRLVEQKLTEAETRFLGRNIPAAFLGPLASSVKVEQCFLVMPYSEDWSSGIESIVNSCCQMTGYKLLVAKYMEGRFVPHDIWQGITGSGVIVADLTGENPNVAYEIGLADAIGRDVILLSQTTDVPFDFSGQRLLLYENTLSGAQKLQIELSSRLKDIRKHEYDSQDA